MARNAMFMLLGALATGAVLGVAFSLTVVWVSCGLSALFLLLLLD